MKKIISLIAWVLILVFSTGLCYGAETVKMTDVDYSTELGKSIDKLVSAGVIDGIPEADGTFTYRSSNHITRAEFCKMINKTFGYNQSADNIFTDVNPDKWYYVEVLVAIKHGYIQGYGNGTFGGEDTITREQVCVILDRIIQKTTDKEVVISDSVSPWAEKAVKNIIGLGYMPLEEGNTFRALQNMTRGENALTLDDFVKVPTKEETKTEDKKEENKEDNKTQAGNTNTGTAIKPSTGSDNSGSDDLVPPAPQTDPKVDAVIKAIAELGKVTLDKKADVEEARKAYDALGETQKSNVTNLSVLTSAEKEIADLEKAKEVIDLISAIGTVTLDDVEDKEDAVEKARKAYKALETQAQKGKVTNYNLLLDAEAALKALDIYDDLGRIVDEIIDLKGKEGGLDIREEDGEWVLYSTATYNHETEEVERDSVESRAIKGGPVLRMLIEASTEILPKRDEGFVVSNEYVRETYDDEIIAMKAIFDSMTSVDENKVFIYELGKLNTGVIMSLVDLFDVNINRL